MRARLLVVLLVFSALAVTAFAWPLLVSTAAQRTQTLLMDRTSHLNRFAAIARHAEVDGDDTELRTEMNTYYRTYGEGLLIVDGQGRRRSVGLNPDDREVTEAYSAALRNQPVPRPDDLRPWSTRDVLLAVPIDTDTWANGAVVLRASVDRAADDIGAAWLRVLGTALAAGVVCVLLALLLARWVLRPLRELEGGVRAVAAGDRGAHIGDRAGPRELRALAGSFNDMAAAVSTAAEQQSRLVADASHELRNPIARLRLTVESVVPYVAPTADRARVRLSTPDSVRVVQVALSEIELKQVVDVAIDNAIKYAGSGAHIRLDCAADGTAGWVAIADDGPGLPETELAMATTRFWRSRRHHGGPGSGLGLAIAERLVTARGGTFRLRANRPRGLVVELTLPLAKESP
jgi:signal transduction histidine kinase